MTLRTILISLLILAAIFAGYNFLVQNNSRSISIREIQTKPIAAKESPSYVLPKGKQIYNVSHGQSVVGPRLSKIIFSPLSFESGESQKITAVFPVNETVGSIVLFVTTDNYENQKINLTKNVDNVTWTGEWIPSDSIINRYSVKIVAVGASGEYNSTMNFL